MLDLRQIQRTVVYCQMLNHNNHLETRMDSRRLSIQIHRSYIKENLCNLLKNLSDLMDLPILSDPKHFPWKLSKILIIIEELTQPPQKLKKV